MNSEMSVELEVSELIGASVTTPVVLMITHDSGAASYSDRVIHMKDGKIDD